jgi:hypothetical protein
MRRHGDEARLLRQGFARRRRNSADNHVADLAFGVAGDNVNDSRGSHGINGAPRLRKLLKAVYEL